MSNLHSKVQFQVYDPTIQKGFNVNFGQLREFILGYEEEPGIKVGEVEKPKVEKPIVATEDPNEGQRDPILDPIKDEDNEEGDD